jgi:hypothetical protein
MTEMRDPEHTQANQNGRLVSMQENNKPARITPRVKGRAAKERGNPRTDGM